MRSSKSRSRNKSNRQRSLGNIVNRVFDSSGPEGKVRGTPQQIIEKYLTLARDAQLSNDRVAEQSFLQHAEHYTRLLGEAQREQAERQQQFNNHRDDDARDDQDGDSRNAQGHGGQQHGSNRNNGNGGNGNGHGHSRDREQSEASQPRIFEVSAPAAADVVAEAAPRPETAPVAETVVMRDDAQGLPPVISTDDAAGPVETPETVAEPAPAKKETARSAAKDAAKDGVKEGARPAVRRRAPRSTAAAGAAPAAPAAPRTRKKAAGETPKEQLGEGSSGK